MLWAWGLYKCHCTWLILPAIVLNSKTWNRGVSDGKKLNRMSAWHASQPAQSIYGSLVQCWAPGKLVVRGRAHSTEDCSHLSQGFYTLQPPSLFSVRLASPLYIWASLLLLIPSILSPLLGFLSTDNDHLILMPPLFLSLHTGSVSKLSQLGHQDPKSIFLSPPYCENFYQLSPISIAKILHIFLVRQGLSLMVKLTD